MTTASTRQRTLALTVPTAVLTGIVTALGALPAQATTSPRPSADRAPLTLPRPTAASPTAVPGSGTYTVVAGDTLWDIAERFRTTVGALIATNGLSRDSVLQPGQVLRFGAEPAPAADPVAPPAAGDYTVVAGDTLWSIAQAHGTTVAALNAANGLDANAIIYPGQTLRTAGQAPAPAPAAPLPADSPAPAATSPAYTVVAGDTLWSIADAHGLSVSDLYAANGIGPGSIIYPGQDLLLAPFTAEPAVAATPSPAPPAPADPYTAPEVVLTPEQTANARTILDAGRALGVPPRGLAIALATAMVESNLTNAPSGDRDSVGLFQQRPSTGWGTREQLSDTGYAARAFFVGAPHTNGLLDIPDWQTLGFGEAAQEVQISDFPGRYALWETQATAWVSQLG